MAFEGEFTYPKNSVYGVEGYKGEVIERRISDHYYDKPEITRVDTKTGCTTIVGGGVGRVSREIIKIREANGKTVVLLDVPFETKMGQTISIFYAKRAGYSIESNHKQRSHIYYAKNHSTGEEFMQHPMSGALSFLTDFFIYAIPYGLLGFFIFFCIFMVVILIGWPSSDGPGVDWALKSTAAFCAIALNVNGRLKKQAKRKEVDRAVISWCQECVNG